MDNRIPPGKRQEETFFIPKSVRGKGAVEVKLFYNFMPEVIQVQEMMIEMGSDNRVIR